MRKKIGTEIKKIEIKGVGYKQELKIIDKDNESFLIVGNNNWVELLQNAINDKKKEVITLTDKNGNFIKEYLDIKDAYTKLKLIPNDIKDIFKVSLNYGFLVSVDFAISELKSYIDYEIEKFIIDNDMSSITLNTGEYDNARLDVIHKYGHNYHKEFNSYMELYTWLKEIQEINKGCILVKIDNKTYDVDSGIAELIKRMCK